MTTRPRAPLHVMVVALCAIFANAPVARARHFARPRPAATNGARQSETIEGKVVEVRRMSRDVTVRTREGTLRHILVPRDAVVVAPHGERGLSGIRRGMAVRVVDGMGSQKVIARTMIARAATGAEVGGRLASHRVSR